MANWADLNKDLLSLIITRIKLPSDHIRISGVCSSWRSVALHHRCTLTHPIPGLMLSLSPPKTTHFRKFLNFPINSQQPFDVLHHKINVPYSLRCCGSHRGWLVLTLDDQNSIFLFNPFIKLHYTLPRLTGVVEKGVLSSSPSPEPSKCVVLVLFQTQGAAFCTLGDVSWIELQVFFYNEVGFCDALFFKGCFYVVDDYGKIYTCNLDDEFVEEISSQPLDVTKTRYMFYLVEIKGHLCRVLRKFSSCESFYYENTIDDDHNCKDATGVGDNLDMTREFRVWKLDPGMGKWVRVLDLGEYALFLGKNNSICLSELEVCGIEGNKIYYTDDRQKNVKHFGFIRPGKDMGSFDMDDSSIDPLCFTQCEWKTDPPAVWVAPLPW